MLNLKDPTLLRQQCYLDGEWCDANDARTIAVTNPATGDVIGSVPHMGALETARAIDAANAAWPSWRKTSLIYIPKLKEKTCLQRSSRLPLR